MKRSILIGIVLGFISFSANAQLPGRGPTLSAGAQLAVPRGEYSELYKGTPAGINASLSMPIFRLPIEAGGGFAWNKIGGEARDVFIADGLGNEQEAELKLNGNAYTYYVHARLRPFNGRFRPYGEVIAGMRTYSVKSKLHMVTPYGMDTDPLKEVNDRDFVWVTGWAVGLQYRLLPGVFLEGRFEKLKGDRAQYINPESISISRTGEYGYQNHQSRTDQFTFSLGLAFSF